MNTTNQIKLQRVLRQGCPLSPFLFKVIVEILRIFLKKAEVEQLCNGVAMGNSGVKVSHLKYVDNTMICCKLDPNEVQNVKRILRCFQLISGLKINFLKSSLIGVGVEQSRLQEWAARVSCIVGTLPTSYLGLPFGANPRSLSTCQLALERFGNKLSR